MKEPDCYGAIEVTTGRAVLFVPRLPPEYSVFMGTVHAPEHFRKLYAVDEVRYVDELRAYIGDRAPPQLHVLQGLNTDSGNVSVPATFDGLDALVARGRRRCQTRCVGARERRRHGL